jgi:hypothetical protein
MNELSTSLNTFNKNAGLAVVGKGKMVQALKALNPALLENIRNAATQAERVRLAADAIDKAKTASEKAAIATALFGDAGAKLVNVFDGGSKAIEATAAKARELGIIIDNQTVAAADDLGDRFDTATTILDTQFKTTLIALAPIMVATTEKVAAIAGAINLVVDSLRDFENQSAATLQREQGTIGLKRLDLQNQILFEKGSPTGNAEIIKDLEAQDAELAKQDAQITDILNKRNKAAAVTGATNDGKGGDVRPLPPLTTPGSPSSRNAAAKQATEQAKAVTDLIAKLQIEHDQVGMTDLQIAEQNALREAGAAATDAQRQKILQLVDSTYQEKQARDALNKSLQESAELGKDVANTVVQGFRDGSSAGEIFQSVLDKIIDKIIDMQINWLFDGSVAGSGGGVLGGLFKPLLGVFSPAPVSGGSASPVAAPAAPANVMRSSSNDTVTIHLQDDSGRMASIADQRIQTHSGTIVNVAVKKSTQIAQTNMPKWANEYQQRAG